MFGPALYLPQHQSSVIPAFKVPPAFRKRFKQCALDADLKLNELLFEALDVWEEKRKLKK